LELLNQAFHGSNQCHKSDTNQFDYLVNAWVSAEPFPDNPFHVKPEFEVIELRVHQIGQGTLGRFLGPCDEPRGPGA
jgi:hypothetical protein